MYVAGVSVPFLPELQTSIFTPAANAVARNFRDCTGESLGLSRFLGWLIYAFGAEIGSFYLSVLRF